MKKLEYKFQLQKSWNYGGIISPRSSAEGEVVTVSLGLRFDEIYLQYHISSKAKLTYFAIGEINSNISYNSWFFEFPICYSLSGGDRPIAQVYRQPDQPNPSVRQTKS